MKATSLAVLAALAPVSSGRTAALSAPGLFRSLFSSDYLPHRFCYLAQPWLIWSNVTADSLITVSYVAIFLSLFWLGLRFRRLPQVRSYLWVCASFGSFIIACAATHLMETVTIWDPVYRLSVAVKIVCAVASVVTAILLVARISPLAHSIERLFDLIASEHRQAEALRKSEALLDRTNHVAGIGGWELDLSTNQVDWSAETARLHGMPSDFRPTIEEGISFFAPEFRDMVVDALQKSLVDGDPWALEIQILRRDGTRLWVRVLGEVEFANGKPVRLFGSFQDKTKEVEQRLALRRTEVILERTNRVAGIGGWELDLITNEAFWSNETARIHGRPPGYQPTLEEGINYFAPECQPRLRAALDAAMSGHGGWDLELPLIRADGRRIWVRLLGDVELLDGKPVRLFGSIQDKTIEFEQREALRKSEALLDRTNRVAGIGGWEFDLITQELLWSDQTARMHGLPPSHKPSYEESFTFFPPEYHPAVFAAVEVALATGKGYELELPLLRADGRRIWVRLIGEVESVDGKPVRIFGSLQDKTLEVEQREALRKSEALLDRTNHVAGIGGWELDLLTNSMTWSAETARIHGLPPGHQPTLDEAISFFGRGYQLAIRSALQNALYGGGGADLELPLYRADGKKIWVRLIAEPEIVDGKAARVFGSIQDKTEEIQRREALRKSELFLDQTNRVAGIGGWEFDLQTRELTWSAQTKRIHGVPEDYVPDPAKDVDFYAPEVRPLIRSTIQAAIANGGGWDLELPLNRADGRRIWIRLIGEVERVDGRPVRIFGSMQDKTEEVDRREALRKSEYLLERANRIAGMGGWEVDLLTNEVSWSAEIARMHGLPPGHKPTIDEAIGFFTPECQAQIHEVIHTAVSGGGGWDVELTLVRVDGQRRYVRHLGEVELLDGLPVKLFGSLQDITEDFERREALRKSQNFLDRSSRIAGVGGWEIDILTGVVTWSDETFRIHALPLSYKPTLEAGLSFYAENSRPIVTAAVQHAYDTGEGWDLETEFIRADEKHIWVRTVGNVEFVDGKPQRLGGAIQDTTAQVNARLALTRANKRAALATESGGIAIWDWDLATNQFICDVWMFRIYGLEPVDGPTHMSLWAEQLHPEDRPLVITALMDAIEDRKPYDMEFRVVWNDGTIHTIKATGQVIRDENGRALHMIGTNRDVTEARRLTAELEEQHELLRVTLLSIADAVVSTDVDRNIVWMNGAAERMTGWNAAEAIGRPVSEVFNIVYEATRLPADVHTNPNLAKARRIAMDEKVLLISRDNVEHNIESCATPIYDNRAQLIGSVLVIRDVTEQFLLARETERITKLQTDLKLKDEFLSHVSHELRSPLTSVYSFTSIVADNLAGDTTPEQQEYLQIVLKNVLQLQSMIEDLLTVTQSKEGKLPIDFQSVAVAPAIIDAIDTYRPAAVAKRISITSGNLANLPEAWSDPVRLRQIMIILLDNAIKFTPDEGHVDIRVVEDGNMLRFEVEDNGCGIPLDKRARIFEKLYQITSAGHADTSQQGRIGLGLGLHIARDLVRRQGGNIWVTGDPERGSTLNFTLPLASDIAERTGVTPRGKSEWPESVGRQLNPAA